MQSSFIIGALLGAAANASPVELQARRVWLPSPVGGQAGTYDQCWAPPNPDVSAEDCKAAVQEALGTGSSNTYIGHVTGSCHIHYVPFEANGINRTPNSALSEWAQGVVDKCCESGNCPTGPEYVETAALTSMGWSLAFSHPDEDMSYDPANVFERK